MWFLPVTKTISWAKRPSFSWWFTSYPWDINKFTIWKWRGLPIFEVYKLSFWHSVCKSVSQHQFSLLSWNIIIFPELILRIKSLSYTCLGINFLFLSWFLNFSWRISLAIFFTSSLFFSLKFLYILHHISNYKSVLSWKKDIEPWKSSIFKY